MKQRHEKRLQILPFYLLVENRPAARLKESGDGLTIKMKPERFE
jgi:hypothetical protein